MVTIDEKGGLWIDDREIVPELFGEGLRAAVGTEKDPKVVVKADSRLSIGEVRRAMIAIEDAGFQGVGLIAKRPGEKAEGK